MIRLLTTISLALLLTACGAESKSDETNLKTEVTTKTEMPTSTTTEEVHAKVAPSTSPKESEKVETPKKEVATEKATKVPVKNYPKDIFTLTTFEGKKLHIDEVEEGILFQEYKGKVVFLLFFGFKCPPCLAEIPVLKALTDEKHDDLKIVAMEVQRLPSELLKEFKADKGINYTLLSGNEGNNAKFVSYIGQRAQWGGSIPFLVVLDPQGEVKVVHVGGMGSHQFKAIYDKLKLEK